MAKTTTRTWANVVDTVCDASGMPKQQVKDTADAIFKGVQTELSTHQPKRDGDILEVETPFHKVTSERVPEQVITDASGQKFTRPSVRFSETIPAVVGSLAMPLSINS